MTTSKAAYQDLPGRVGDGGIALFAALTYLVLQAASGIPSLSSTSDNDSLMRLVQIRDLLGGQGWFDLHQYRMGPSGGFVMHWSRLVDAPIAAIIAAATAISGTAETGETIALVLWPALLFATALYFLLRAARFYAGDEALLPALLIGAASLHYLGIFLPGSLDHHNAQLVLVLGMLCFLAEATRIDSARLGAAGGACAALLLGVAIEAAPYVAVAGLCAALWLLLMPLEKARTVCGFGLAFGGFAAAIFVATIPPSAWSLEACDAYSLPEFAAASLSGFGIAALAGSSTLRGHNLARLASLAGLGLCLVAMMLMFFPQCLGDPYSGLDPRIRSWWLDAVTEAQPVWKIALVSPELAAGRYGPPALALIYLAIVWWRGDLRVGLPLLAGMLAAAFLVSLWQVRGSVFSIPLAAIALSSLVVAARRQAHCVASPSATSAMVLCWLLSFNVAWAVAADGVSSVRSGKAQVAGDAVKLHDDCQQADDFRRLAELPPSVVLTISNLGAPVLRYTAHRTLSGPYHRNIDGNLATLDILAGPAVDALGILRGQGVEFIALCRGNSESTALAKRAPDGLLASLMSRQIPNWLKLMPESREQALEIYRVTNPS